MYKIEKMPFGYQLTFGGSMDAVEMQHWYDESKRTVAFSSGKDGVVIDMRELKPLAAEAQKIMVEAQGWYRKKGMAKSAVILANTVLTMQFRRLAKESGIDVSEKYIDASKHPNFLEDAKKWVVSGIEPV